MTPEFARYWRSGFLGPGVYLTRSFDVASMFGNYIVCCSVLPGTRVLRLEGEYDPSVTKYLSREFGREILSPRFPRAILANKRLTKAELITLLNFIFSKVERDDRQKRDRPKWIEGFGWIREQLRRRGFQANLVWQYSIQRGLDPSRFTKVPARIERDYGAWKQCDLRMQCTDGSGSRKTLTQKIQEGHGRHP